MRKILTYGFLVMIVALGSCKKDAFKVTTLPNVPVPQITKDPSGDQKISAVNPLGFNGKIIVDVFSKTGTAPAKYDILVRKKNNTVDSVKIFKADVSTFPVTLGVTGQQLATLFGTAPALGDDYQFAADIYTNDGSKYQAFPKDGSSYLPNYAGNITGLSLSTTFSALCVYVPDDYQGNFVVIKDDWQDTNPGDIVTLTKIDDTHFAFSYPSVVNLVAPGIIVTVNPVDNSISIAKQIVGTKWNYATGGPYPNPTFRSAGKPNTVAPCDKIITLTLYWGYNGAEQGPGAFILKKQ